MSGSLLVPVMGLPEVLVWHHVYPTGKADQATEDNSSSSIVCIAAALRHEYASVRIHRSTRGCHLLLLLLLPLFVEMHCYYILEAQTVHESL
jgi:hypothetical protein